MDKYIEFCSKLAGLLDEYSMGIYVQFNGHELTHGIGPLEDILELDDIMCVSTEKTIKEHLEEIERRKIER